MSSGDRAPEEAAGGIAVVRRLRHRQLVDRIDYLRGLRRLARTMTQSDLARALGLTQPSISSALKSAHKVPDPRPGFSGASPYEIAQRFAAGRLTREAMIDELARWDQVSRREGLRGLGAGRRAPGILGELRKAVRDGLIDQPTHDTILIRHRRLERTRT
jgi:transcriptional regulator with XRE-family HTH domain